MSSDTKKQAQPINNNNNNEVKTKKMKKDQPSTQNSSDNVLNLFTPVNLIVFIVAIAAALLITSQPSILRDSFKSSSDVTKPHEENPFSLLKLADFQHKVVELNLTSIYPILSHPSTQNHVWLVRFFRDNCQFCTNELPKWEAAVERVLAGEKQVLLATIDLNVDPTWSISYRFDIMGVPAIHVFANGYFFKYNLAGWEYVDFALKVAENAFDDALMSEQYDPNAQIGTLARPGYIDPAKVPKIPSNVTDLTGSNFEHRIKSGVWFVKFYGPLCGGCRTSAPKWEALATKVKADNIDVNIAKINAMEFMTVANKYDAFPWPSLIRFENGLHWKYAESYSEKSVEEYIQWVTEEYKADESSAPLTETEGTSE